MKHDLSPIRYRIKTRRRELGLTQQELAEICEITAAQISHLETGKRLPTIDLLVTLCIALRTTPNYLFQDLIPVEPSPPDPKDLRYPPLPPEVHTFFHSLLAQDLLPNKSVQDYLDDGYALEDIPYGIEDDRPSDDDTRS